MSEVAKVFYQVAEGEWAFGPYPGTSGVVVRWVADTSLKSVAETHSLPFDLVQKAFGQEAAKELREEADELEGEAKADEKAAKPAKPAKHKKK